MNSKCDKFRYRILNVLNVGYALFRAPMTGGFNYVYCIDNNVIFMNDHATNVLTSRF